MLQEERYYRAMSINNSSRKPEIGILNVLMCLAVVFIHVSGEAVTNFIKPSAASLLIYIPWKLSAFAVPGFIFVSGMKQMLSYERHSYGKYLLGRLKGVVLPYIIWNVVYYAYFVSHGYYTFSFHEFLQSILYGTLSAQFYFVVIIIQFYLLRPLWKLIVDRYHPLPVLGCAMIVTLICSQYIPFWFSDRLLFAYPVFWLAGCYAAKYYDTFTHTLKRFKTEVTGLFLFFGTALILFTYLTFCQLVFFGFLGILQTAYSLSAICAAYLLCMYIPEIKWLKLLDASSYGIYLMHCLVLIIADDFINRIGITSVKGDFLVKTVVVYAVSLGGCMIYTYIKNKFIKSRLQKQ